MNTFTFMGLRKSSVLKQGFRDCPGGPLAETLQGTWVQSLEWGDPLEERMATHSSILAWRIPWTEEPGGLQSMGSQRVGHVLAIKPLPTIVA